MFELSRFTVRLVSAGLLLASGLRAGEILLLGNPSERSVIQGKILKPNGIRHKNSEVWVRPQDYGKYAAVLYAGKASPGGKWSAPDEIAALRSYLANGGTVIVCSGAINDLSGTKRSLKPLEKILGFALCGAIPPGKYDAVKFTAAGARQFPGAPFTRRSWHWSSTNGPAKITSAKVLAEYTGPGTQPRPAVLVNDVGSGRCFTINPSLHGLTRQMKSLGTVDGEGVFTLNEDGLRLQALEQLYLAVLKQVKGLEVEQAANQSSWGTKPLGSPGHLKFQTERVRQPKFRPPATPKPALLLAENGQPKAVIVCADPKSAALARELKYHLDRITGGDFRITNKKPAQGPFIELVPDSSLPPETAVARTEKGRVLLSGPADGLPLAVFYFLEKLGCRYLWPGELGKVIPSKPTLHAPKMDLKAAPTLQARRVRHNVDSKPSSLSTGMRLAGVRDLKVEQDYARLYSAKSVDHKGNSRMFRWHGQGARTHYQWGHAMGYLWKKYGAEHPEYFALQANGSRSQAAAPDRPRLCKSNPGLAEAIFHDAEEYFTTHPKANSRSVCLNDGGHTCFCMCENCRKLDPVNAYPITMNIRQPGGGIKPVAYVSLTDRVLFFFNRVAEQLVRKFPDKKLSIYIYSHYSTLPVKVRPHPAMVLYLTDFSYTNEARRQRCLNDYAKWCSFGNPVLFRPNALLGFAGALAPQNYARKIFNDLEFFKANGLVGTDYDCNEKHWSCKGLTYYALLKAHWNPDRLDFDAILDDYCRSGFGPAAEEVKQYFLQVEKITDQAAAERKPYLECYTPAAAAELRKLLDQAEAKAGSDELVRKRIAFLKLGLTAGDYSVAMHQALKRKDRAGFLKVRQEMRQWLQKTMFESPFAIYPPSLSRQSGLAVR
ncbi:MAG: DUF4838 domain-containing protein [Lentisphaeria bacterium]|nr:DUF4838 domain-containing protein [Lentisphaeria bacterium]